jgi:ribonuclease BN (tRNA processing enzyme)
MSSSGMSIIRLTFLGTSAAAPTLHRNVSGLAFKADTDLLLFDCGEGSQRQMIRFGTGFAVDAVFFTHFHADHYLGIIGFLRTLGMGGRLPRRGCSTRRFTSASSGSRFRSRSSSCAAARPSTGARTWFAR